MDNNNRQYLVMTLQTEQLTFIDTQTFVTFQHVYGIINDLMYKLGGISTVNVQMNNILTTTILNLGAYQQLMNR